MLCVQMALNALAFNFGWSSVLVVDGTMNRFAAESPSREMKCDYETERATRIELRVVAQ